MSAKIKTYRVAREWTVVMRSWVEVEAANVNDACAAALEADDFDDQEILDGSDGPTFIGTVERDGEELRDPYHFSEEGTTDR